jgi:NitT/TauT family transport system substrate-binding protein
MRLDPAGVPLPNRSRHAFRARYLLAAVCGVSLLAAAGCGSSGSSGGTVSSIITIAAVPGVDDAAIYLAQKDGLFAAEGLTHVRIQSYKTQAQVMNALDSAHPQADIAASDYGAIFYQEAQSAHPKSPQLRILADGYDATPGVLEVLTLPGSKITSPLQLANATVGLPEDSVLSALTKTGAPPSLDAAAAVSVLTNYMGPAADFVHWDPMSQSQEVSQLEQRKLKAILVSEPYIYQAESGAGAVEVFDVCSGSTAGLPLLGYVAMNAWVRDNPAAVADFQAALAKAQSEAAMTGKIRGVLPSGADVRAQDADLITIGTYPTSTSIQNLDQVAGLMSNSGMFTQLHTPQVRPMIVGPTS